MKINKKIKERLKKEKIKKENQQFETVLIIFFGLLLILIIIFTNGFEGIDKIIKCKTMNHNQWCNKYQLEKMED